MIQAKFSLDQSQLEFVGQYHKFGFKDKSALVRAALAHLQRELEQQQLQVSADLYAEVYTEEPDLQELTEVALTGWPE